MLVGTILGIIITLLVLFALWLKSQNSMLKSANKEQAQEIFAAQLALGRVAKQEQERALLKESIVFNLTESQVTELAHKISGRIRTIIDAEQQAALGRLD